MALLYIVMDGAGTGILGTLPEYHRPALFIQSPHNPLTHTIAPESEDGSLAVPEQYPASVQEPVTEPTQSKTQCIANSDPARCGEFFIALGYPRNRKS